MRAILALFRVFKALFHIFKPSRRCGCQMGLNEGCVWMSLGGVGHVELSEGFFGLIDCPLMCEGRSSTYGRQMS